MTSQEAQRIHELEDMGMHAEAHQVWRDSHRNDVERQAAYLKYLGYTEDAKRLLGDQS